MAWQTVAAQDHVVEFFRRAIQKNRLASSFLFVGPQGVGKRTFAMQLARLLLCQDDWMQTFEPCGHCESCTLFAAQAHPDLQLISKPKDKSFIPVAMFLGDKNDKSQPGLYHHLSLKPMLGTRKIAIIDDADFLNKESANSLLKTLEEPPSGSVLILIGTSASRQLPTIRSRCQLIRFNPLPQEIIAQLLLDQEIVDDDQFANQIASFCDGSLQQATDFASSEVWDFRQALFQQLSDPRFDHIRLCSCVQTFVEDAGTAASARRERMRLAIGFAISFYRQLLRIKIAVPVGHENDLQLKITEAANNWPSDVEILTDSLDRCVEALLHVDRNANQATMLECWIDDLAGIAQDRLKV